MTKEALENYHETLKKDFVDDLRNKSKQIRERIVSGEDVSFEEIANLHDYALALSKLYLDKEGTIH